MGRRRPVYFSNIKDNDLMSYIVKLETHYDFSFIAKELMRDGMKYRRLLETGQIFESGEQPKYYKVPQSNTVKKTILKPQSKKELSDIKLEKKQVDEEDIGSRLLDF